MKKRLLWTAALLLMPAIASAQVVTKPAYAGYEAFLLGNQASGYSFRFRLWNQSPKVEGVVSVVSGFNVHLSDRVMDLACQPLENCGFNNLSGFVFPPVDTRTWTVPGNPWTLSSNNSDMLANDLHGDTNIDIGWWAADGGLPSPWKGIIGCSVPEPLFEDEQYAFRTCGNEGYFGYAQWQFDVNFFESTPLLTLDDFVVEIHGDEILRTTLPIPEPTTYALMSLGLGALLVAQRKARRRTL